MEQFLLDCYVYGCYGLVVTIGAVVVALAVGIPCVTMNLQFMAMPFLFILFVLGAAFVVTVLSWTAYGGTWLLMRILPDIAL